MRILIIEDEPDLLRALSQMLREAGYAVDLAAGGRAGLMMATNADYDAILLDLMLPEMDGCAVLQELRQSKTTPVLVLTARDAIADRVRGLELGADDYLIKPFEMPELLARVHALIRRSEGGAVALAEVEEVTGTTLVRTAQSLASARRIQLELMPRKLPRIPGVDVAFHYEPAQCVGGDYCDVWKSDDTHLAFVVADVAGKGVPAAMVMAGLQASLRAGAAFCRGPAEAIEYVNEHLACRLPDGLFVTLFFGQLNVETGRLDYVNAGHVLPLLRSSGGHVESVGSPVNSVLGIGGGPFVAQSRMLAPDDTLIVVTDGITESESAEGEMLGTGGLRAILQSEPIATAEDLVRQVTAGASRHRGGNPASDDLTVLAVRRM